MNVGEFFIQLGINSDTKELKQTIKDLEDAERKTARLIKREKELEKATSEEQKALIKKNYAQKDEIDKNKQVLKGIEDRNTAIKNSINSSLKMITAVAGTITVLDRLGNALLRNNQAYISFNRQTGISISKVNSLSSVAQMASMNMSPEAVMGDLSSLQQRAFRIGLEGGNTKIFQMMGFNPIGMSGNQILEKVRQYTKINKLSADAVTYMLDELGISREWVNVLMLGDEAYEDMKKKSKELQLSETQRKKLAELTAKQQQNNLRWQKIKNELLIAILPHVQNIMEVTSKTVNKIVESESSLKTIGRLLRDAAFVFAGIQITSGKLLQNIKSIASLGALSGLFGGFAKKQGAKALGKAAIGGLVPGLNIAMLGWMAWDIINAGKEIGSALRNTEEILEDANDSLNTTIEPIETSARNSYNNIQSHMTNNFYNNPQPAGQITTEMGVLIDKYLQSGVR